MKIDQEQEQDYECVRIVHVGFVDPYAVEGLVILRVDDNNNKNNKEFHMRAFSGETAKYITSFLDQDSNHDVSEHLPPPIYKMIEEICEHSGMLLVKIKIYQSGQALRANLYFTGKTELVLRNYKASDALALAVYYNIPILVRKNLLEVDDDEEEEEKQKESMDV